ncbi:unnamed protein product [Owenia fusiformis]|uniref:Uncharacterized protein n=1 Tax=Owenia fusiformis TaxID=6347 RepID=A0A8J1UAY2_OWEFU|nr:unnamed protein product [Owenia fusiformis]
MGNNSSSLGGAADEELLIPSVGQITPGTDVTSTPTTLEGINETQVATTNAPASVTKSRSRWKILNCFTNAPSESKDMSTDTEALFERKEISTDTQCLLKTGNISTNTEAPFERKETSTDTVCLTKTGNISTNTEAQFERKETSTDTDCLIKTGNISTNTEAQFERKETSTHTVCLIKTGNISTNTEAPFERKEMSTVTDCLIKTGNISTNTEAPFERKEMSTDTDCLAKTENISTNTEAPFERKEMSTDTDCLIRKGNISTNTEASFERKEISTDTDCLIKMENTSTDTENLLDKREMSTDTGKLVQKWTETASDSYETFPMGQTQEGKENGLKLEILNKLEQEEKEITSNLKQLNIIQNDFEERKSVLEDQRKEQSNKHVMALCDIGNIHRWRAKLTARKLEYVKSIALFECAEVHLQECSNDVKKQESERIKQERKFTLREFLSGSTMATLDDKVLQFEKDNNTNKDTLRKIREIMKTKLRNLNREHGGCPIDLDEAHKKLEKEYIEQVSEILKWNHGEIKKFIELLVNQSRKMFEFYNDDFAFIAFGSFSRKETTPFSDVEFAVVVNTNDFGIVPEYKVQLMNIIMCVHIKLLMLGETILPAMHIDSLKDLYYDDRTHVSVKQGMSFDGLMPHANKTPYFEDPQNEFSLTDTKKASMRYFEANGNLSKILYFYKGDFEILYGDDSVADEMKDLFKKDGVKRNKIIDGIMKEFKGDLMKYSCTKKIYDAKFNEHLLTDIELSVKKELYRLPSVVINNLLHLLGSKTTCIWDVKGVKGLSDDNLHNLTMILALATEFRLRCYAENNGQVDEVKGQLFPDVFLSENKEKSKQFIEDLVLRYYMTAIPLVSSIEQHSHKRGETGVTKEQKGEALLKAVGTQPLYDASLLNHAMAYLLIEKDEKAKEYLGKANAEYLKQENPVDHNKLILQILLNMYINDADNSNEFLNLGPRVIDTSNSDVVNTLGNALIQRGEPHEAEKVLKECANKHGTDECYKLLTTALVKNRKGEELQKILTEKPELQLRERLKDDIDAVITQWQQQQQQIEVLRKYKPKTIQREGFSGYPQIHSLAAAGTTGIVMIVLSGYNNYKAILCNKQLKEMKTLNTTGNPYRVISSPDGLGVAVLCERDDNTWIVQVFNTSGDHKRDIPLPDTIKPKAIAVNSIGQMVIADGTNGSLVFINWQSGKVEHTTPSGLFTPSGLTDRGYKTCTSGYYPFIAVTKQDHITISNRDTNIIRCVDSHGEEVFTYSGEGKNALNRPRGVCVDTLGNILVADFGNNRVQLLSPDGTFIRHVLSESDGLKWPWSLAMDTEDNLLIGTGLPPFIVVIGELPQPEAFIVKYKP